MNKTLDKFLDKLQKDLEVPYEVYFYTPKLFTKIDNFYEYGFEEILVKLNEKKHRLDKEMFSSRVINHWEKMGLIDSSRQVEKGWRRYNIIDLVWLDIIYELRKFGISLDHIQKIKKIRLCTELNFRNKKRQYNFIEFFSVAAISRMSVEFLYFPEGIAFFVFTDHYEKIVRQRFIENHIRISVNDILSEILGKDCNSFSRSEIQLSLNEIEYVLSVQLDEWSKIAITNEDGEEFVFNCKDEDDRKLARKINNFIYGGTYNFAELRKANGNILTLKKETAK